MSHKKLKVFVVGGADHYASWIPNHTIVDEMPDADLVIFSGGEDVDPSLYGEPRHYSTMSNLGRDKYELMAFKAAKAQGLPMWGTCRGAQFLCVAAGGKLVQDQNNPWFMHEMFIGGDQTIMVSSTHHQAQYPWGMPATRYQVLGWTRDASFYHMDGNDKEMISDNLGGVCDGREVEVCYYPKIKAVGVQGHPEMLDCDHEFPEYCRGLLKQLLHHKL